MNSQEHKNEIHTLSLAKKNEKALAKEIEALEEEMRLATLNQNEKLYEIFSLWLAMESRSPLNINKQGKVFAHSSYGQLNEHQGRCAITMEV